MRHIFLFLPIISIIFSCCNNPKKNQDFLWVDTEGMTDGVSDMDILSDAPSSIKIDNDKTLDFLLLSEVADSLSILRLESNRSSIIGSVDKIIKSQDSYYILDRRKSSGVYSFSENGSHLHTIGKRGRGHGEYHEPTDFDILGDTVVILDQFKTCLNYYSNKGQYLTTKKIPFYATGLSIMNDTTYLFNSIDADNDHLKDIVNYSLLMTDSALSIRKKGFYREHGKYFSMWVPENFYRDSDYTIFHPALSDMIYSISISGCIRRRFHINFGNHALPEELTFQSHWNDFKKESTQRQYLIFPGKSFETDNYLFLEYLDNHESRYAFYDKKTKIVKNAKYLLNDLDVQFPIETIAGCFGNTLIGVVSPSVVIQAYMSMKEKGENGLWSTETIKLASEISPDNNLILLLIHMK